MSDQTPYHAEYLSKLGQMSVTVQVQTDLKLQQVLDIKLISTDTMSININDDGNNIKSPLQIRLPVCISQFSIKSARVVGRNLALSLSVQTIEKCDKNEKASNEIVDDLWSCKWLKSETPTIDKKNVFQFVCFKCKHLLIDSQNHVFKDMPNEYWYELMDFWHCHKPETGEFNDKNFNTLKPSDNATVLIGSYYLLQLHNEYLEISKLDPSVYICRNCGNEIGEKYQNIVRLLKWHISLQRLELLGRDVVFLDYNPLLYCIGLLKNKVNSLAIRKFQIEKNDKHHYIDGPMYIWIISTEVDVTIDGSTIHDGLKIWYTTQELPPDEATGYEEIEIPYKEARDSFFATVKKNTIKNDMSIKGSIFSESYIGVQRK